LLPKRNDGGLVGLTLPWLLLLVVAAVVARDRIMTLSVFAAT
jgi:hypothetical protein